MKKLLSLAVVAAALCASVGCEDKKTSAPVKVPVSSSVVVPSTPGK
jgi:hypothetical protein